MAGFVAFCQIFAQAGSAKPTTSAIPSAFGMGGLLFLALCAALTGAFLGIAVKSVGVAIPARCGSCRRWAVRRVSTRPATAYRCGRCGVLELVANEAGSPAQNALDDVARERVEEALHESSPAAGQLSTLTDGGGTLSPPAATGKLALKE